MKFPLREALRRDGKTHRPPAEVELDVERDAAEIDQLVGMGVIADVREAAATDAEAEAQAEAEAKAKAEAEAEAKAKTATKNAKAKE